MNLLLELKQLVEINPYLLILFFISTAFWALVILQLKIVCGIKPSMQIDLSKYQFKKTWGKRWLIESHQNSLEYNAYKNQLVMKALLITLPMVGLAGTVMILSNGFYFISLSSDINIRNFSGIVTGAMATTFAGVFLSLTGILLLKTLEVLINRKQREFKLCIVENQL